jgi:hypothetical protein
MTQAWSIDAAELHRVYPPVSEKPLRTDVMTRGAVMDETAYRHEIEVRDQHLEALRQERAGSGRTLGRKGMRFRWVALILISSFLVLPHLAPANAQAKAKAHHAQGKAKKTNNSPAPPPAVVIPPDYLAAVSRLASQVDAVKTQTDRTGTSTDALLQRVKELQHDMEPTKDASNRLSGLQIEKTSLEIEKLKTDLKTAYVIPLSGGLSAFVVLLGIRVTWGPIFMSSGGRKKQILL